MRGATEYDLKTEAYVRAVNRPKGPGGGGGGGGGGGTPIDSSFQRFGHTDFQPLSFDRSTDYFNLVFTKDFPKVCQSI